MERYREAKKAKEQLSGVSFDEHIFKDAQKQKRRREQNTDDEKDDRWVLQSTSGKRESVYHNQIANGGPCLTISKKRFDLLHLRHLGDEKSFSKDLEDLVLRYAPLSKGLQASIPPTLMASLEKDFEISTEGFASPLNSQLNRYCSVFPEDTVFGSLGSFFNQKKFCGSIEINPPFVASIILQAFDFMTNQLKLDSDEPLQFIVIVPIWNLEECYLKLCNSAFLSRKIDFVVRKHSYLHSSLLAPKDSRLVCGVEHASTNESSMFFLQNDLAKKKWTISNNAVRRIEAAFLQKQKPEENQTAPKLAKTPVGSNWKALKKKLKK